MNFLIIHNTNKISTFFLSIKFYKPFIIIKITTNTVTLPCYKGISTYYELLVSALLPIIFNVITVIIYCIYF